MEAPVEACVTEIRCEKNQIFRVGTGYLICPELVLTACHVIAEAGTRPSEVSVEVRPLADARSGRSWRSAKVLWPKPEDWSRFFEIDVAVLEIGSDDYTRAIAQPVPLGWGQLRTNRSISVTAVGFPNFKYDSQNNSRDSQQVFGEVAPLSGSKKRLFEIQYKGKRPKPKEDWHGISGAGLFAEGRLIGVVTLEVVGGDIDFKAVRLEAALETPDFHNLISSRESGHNVEICALPQPDLTSLVCLVNRESQESHFRSAFNNLLSSAQSSPLSCLVVGQTCHRPDELVNRFGLDTIPRLRKQPNEPTEFRPIAWPRRVLDPVIEFADLRRLLWNFLSDLDENIPSDNDVFRLRLEDKSRPYLFKSEITAGALSVNQATLFASWLSFWSKLRPTGTIRPPVHFILITDGQSQDVKSWLNSVPVPDGLERCLLPELDFCYWQDLDEWIDRRIPLWRPSVKLNLRALKDDLEAELEGPRNFSLAELKKAVRKVAKPAQSFGVIVDG
jgi:hypothetical protein